MRHGKKIKKLNLARDERRKLIRNIGTSLVLYEKIKTTKAKAKAIVPYVDRLVTIAKQKDELKARRELLKLTFDKNAVEKLIKEIKPKYKDRAGGYTQIYKTISRKGDAASMAYIKFT